jgi:hypothetical protein
MDMNRLIDRKFTMPLLIVLLLLSVLVGCQTGGAARVRPKKVARLSGLEGVVKQAPTVAK